MATPENTNFAKLCRMIIDLLAEIQRDVLTAYQNPNTFPGKTSLKKLNISAPQWIVVNDIRNRMNYSQLDNILLYGIIRNLCPSRVKPISGWGKDVKPSDKNLPDDIERIRQIRNKCFGNTKEASINKVDYDKVVQEIRDICSRFDTKHGNILTLQGAGNYCQMLTKIERESLDASTVEEYKLKLKYLEKEEIGMKERLTKVEADNDSHDQRLDSLDQRLDSLEKQKEIKEPAVATEKDACTERKGIQRKSAEFSANCLPSILK